MALITHVNDPGRYPDLNTFDADHPFKAVEYTIPLCQHELHVHDCLQVGLVLRGNALFQIERKMLPFTAGDIMLINSNDAHRSHSVGNGRAIALFLYIHASILTMIPSLETRDRIAGIFSLGGQVFSYRFRSAVVEHALLDISRELKGGASLSIDMALLRIHELLILLYREFENDLAAGNAVRRDAVHNAGFRDVISAINRDPCAASSVADLAASAGMSDSYFRKVFRGITGLSPLAYINARRLRKAYLLIRQGATSQQAAFATGFENYGHFLKLFKNEFSVGPKELKRSVKKSK